jgi:hypothetical protein
MGSPVSEPQAAAISPLERYSIQSELQNLLASAAFHGSRRSQDFLACVVTKTLQGGTDDIKERTIAIDVFGRHPDRDLDHDSIVRVGAREVRKRLIQYYATEGRNSAIRIELPTGSYIPQFHKVHEPGPSPATAPDPNRKRMLWIPGTALVVAAILVTALSLRPLPKAVSPEPFDVFWQPILQQRSPALIVLAHPVVYRPSRKTLELDHEMNTGSGVPVQRSITARPGEEFVPVVDKYVGLGDSAAAFRMGELMGQRGHTATLRLATQVQFADLCDSGAVLIGAFTNRWTMELMKGLRYRFVLSGENPGVIDTVHGREWTLRGRTDDENSSEDYMIITRLQQARTGRFLVAAAGLTQYGTEETGRILASPEALTPILSKLPANWRTRNLQVVLHSEILGGSPARPEVAAWWIW